MIDPQVTVAQLVLDHSECAAVLRHHRIDFCCRGGVSIAEACAQRNIEPATLLSALERAIAQRGGVSDDLRALDTDSLLQHIVTRYHDALRTSLPFLEGLAAKVHRVHGGQEPRLGRLDARVRELSTVLLRHLDEEEQTLFPALRHAAGERASAPLDLGAMHREHLELGAMLEGLRETTDDYALPERACTSYRTLFAELERLEGDLFEHVHVENHVLAPRFSPAPVADRPAR